MGSNVTEFRGRDAFQAWLHAVDQVEGGTISPGGAAQLLGISRQRIHQLIESGQLRAWFFYEDRPKPGSAYIEVSARDVLAHGIRTGRLQKVGDCGIQWPRLAEEFERLLTA